MTANADLTSFYFDRPGEWYCQLNDGDFGRTATLGLARIDKEGSRETFAIDRINIVAVPQTDVVPHTLRGSRNEIRRLLQAIVDEAWNHGIKPAGYAEAIMENAAQRRHLEDMRALVFKDKKP